MIKTSDYGCEARAAKSVCQQDQLVRQAQPGREA